MRRFLLKPKFILLACQPKTASTFLTTTLGGLPGGRVVRLMPRYDRREQELCEIRLRKHQFRKCGLRTTRHLISAAHVRNSASTQRLIDIFNMKTVVLTRDLFDSVVSIRDHIRRESTVWPMAWFDERHSVMDDEALACAIAHLMVPWYLNFYYSWKTAPSVLHVDYDDIALDPLQTIERIAAYCGVAATKADITAAMGSARTAGSRYNKGKTGRGDYLPNSARRAIRRIVETYPGSQDDPYFRRVYAS